MPGAPTGFTISKRFLLIKAGMSALAVRSCLIDGEAVCCEVDGVPSFELLRHRHHDGAVFLYAFDRALRRDLRPAPLEVRHDALSRLLRQVKSGVHLSDHVEADGPAVVRHACALGVEGIISKREGSPYRSGRTVDWIKVKNPHSPAAKRDAEGFDGGNKVSRLADYPFDMVRLACEKCLARASTSNHR
jgi:bifunctional non-homologous end joining protein LigD